MTVCVYVLSNSLSMTIFDIPAISVFLIRLNLIEMISSILNNALVVIIYVSESRAPFVNKIRETIALHSKSVCLAHSFVDEPYNQPRHSRKWLARCSCP